ncbi:MAG: WG repeat-containing protein [Bacteroidales bacterium]
MKKHFLLAICILIAGVSVAQDLKPKKDKATKKYGYIDKKTEEWIVKPEYDDADKIRDGFGVIYLKKKQGLINEKGEVLVTPQYDDIDKFRDGVAIVKKGKKYSFINKEGKQVVDLVYTEIDDFKDGVAWMRKDSLEGNRFLTVAYGLIDMTGKEIFAPQFSQKLKFDSKGYAVSESFLNNIPYVDNKVAEKFYGIVHKDGRTILPMEAKGITSENNMYIVNDKDGQWFLLNSDFKQVGQKYEAMTMTKHGLSESYIVDGLIIVKNGGKYGFIDKNGNVIVEPKHDEIHAYGYSQGLCAIREGSLWGYIDKKGNYFKEPIYDKATNFTEATSAYHSKYPTIATGAIIAFVTYNGQECVLYKDGKITTTGGANVSKDSKPVASTPKVAVTPVASQTSTTETPVATKPAVKQTTTTAAATDENTWLLGKWTVVEEKMAGKTATGNKVKFVSWEFKAGGSGVYVERTDLLMNQTQTKKTNWSLTGNKLKIGGANYTITPSADKKSMSMSGPLGASWKVKK